MYTYGYIREAVQAHLDLDEKETQAMHLQERYHIFANEAMQAICAVKPKYEYFMCNIVKEYEPVINLGGHQFRKATVDEINWRSLDAPEPNFADEIDTKLWYEGQNIYLKESPVKMPSDFIAFADKQAWAFIIDKPFNLESFIKHDKAQRTESGKIKARNEHFEYIGANKLIFHKEGEFWVPYKAVWYKFQSGIADDSEIDMPVDILLTIPVYIASICLQMDHAQKALVKRTEFETMLARCTTTDFMQLKSVTPTFR